MVDGVGSSYSYRDQWANNLLDTGASGTEETEKTGQDWNAVFTEKKDNGVTVDDFLTLMVAQLKNQDFMNPVDDTQYVTQLAQFATMQQMQEMATYMKTNYVMSLVGKNVTAAKVSVSGELQKETGAVQKISLVNNEYAVYVNGKKFTLEQIMEVNASSGASGSEEQEDPVKAGYLISLIGKTVTVRERDEDGEPLGKETGVVEKVSTADGEYRVYVNGQWYPLDDVLQVDGVKPEEPEPETPDVDEPGGTTETPDVNEPGGSTEPPDVNEPGGTTETPDVNEPGGTTETPDVNEPGETTETPDINEPEAGEPAGT